MGTDLGTKALTSPLLRCQVGAQFAAKGSIFPTLAPELHIKGSDLMELCGCGAAVVQPWAGEGSGSAEFKCKVGMALEKGAANVDNSKTGVCGLHTMVCGAHRWQEDVLQGGQLYTSPLPDHFFHHCWHSLAPSSRV